MKRKGQQDPLKGYSDKSLFLLGNMVKYRVDIPTGGNKYALSKNTAFVCFNSIRM